MSPEEADKAYADSPAIPISEEEANRLVDMVMRHVRKHTDDEIRSMSSRELICDCIPGNYVATTKQSYEIADEITRVMQIKWKVNPSA